jgi:hypothetical protein
MSELGGRPAMPRILAVEDEKLTCHAVPFSTSVTGLRIQGQVYKYPGKSKIYDIYNDLYIYIYI